MQLAEVVVEKQATTLQVVQAVRAVRAVREVQAVYQEQVQEVL